MKVITQNKKAYFDYEILDKIEAGIVLTGDEVKSIRAGHVNLTGSFATISGGQMILTNCTITPYSKAFEKKEGQSTRSRVLLLHKREINRIAGDISKKGITIVALRMYFNDDYRVKIELGICKHKKAAGKKEALRERDIKREAGREIRSKF